jgi:hypothetical protein
MFRCESCHTEYGGIRGLPAGTCPRCRERQGGSVRPAATSTVLARSSPSPRFATSSWSIPTMPLGGEIARLDRAVRF